MRAAKLFYEKLILNHEDGRRSATLELGAWRVPSSADYPDGVKFRAWLCENGETIFGLDNHKPKGPHFHIRGVEVRYLFRGLDSLREDVVAMVRNEGFEI